jgi:predicted Zn-ribbon and HTH transcriptional regulator
MCSQPFPKLPAIVSMKRTRLALFNDRTQAEPVQQRLALAGITTEIHEELRLQRFWFVSKRAAGVRLEVAADQFERAEKLLLGWDAMDGILARAIRCPECHSLCVDYPQFAKNSLLTNLAVGLSAEVGLVEKDYYCEHCHYTWPKERTGPARTRQHMAPYYFIEGMEHPVPPRLSGCH